MDMWRRNKEGTVKVFSMPTDTAPQNGKADKLAGIVSASSPTGRPAYMFVLGWNLSPERGVDQAVINLFDEFGEGSVFRPLCHVPSWEIGTPMVEDIDGRLTFRQRMLSPWHPSRILQPLWFLMRLPQTLFALRRFAVNERVEVVNIHFPGLDAVNYAIARRLGLIDVKLILTFHNSDIHQISEAPAVPRRFYRYLLHAADAIVSNSEGLLRRILAEFPEFSTKSHVIHYGLDIERFHNETAQTPKPSLPARYVLSTGILDWRKGHDILLKAFADCAAQHSDVQLVLLGPPGDAADWIEEQIRLLGLQDRVLLPGGVSHGMVGRYLEGAEIFVLASRREGLPVAILEAGMFGKPVIGTTVDGIPEMIRHDETGLLVEPDDVDGLSRSLNFLLGNRAVATRLGDALERKLVMEFTRRRAYHKYLALCGVASETARGFPG